MRRKKKAEDAPYYRPLPTDLPEITGPGHVRFGGGSRIFSQLVYGSYNVPCERVSFDFWARFSSRLDMLNLHNRAYFRKADDLAPWLHLEQYADRVNQERRDRTLMQGWRLSRSSWPIHQQKLEYGAQRKIQGRPEGICWTYDCILKGHPARPRRFEMFEAADSSPFSPTNQFRSLFPWN